MTKVEKLAICGKDGWYGLELLIDSLKQAPNRDKAACLLLQAIIQGSSREMEEVRQAVRAGERILWPEDKPEDSVLIVWSKPYSKELQA